ncbi:hypothetical protein MVEN_01101600 [Mycena venus]|uniref:Uncharacterized protein n=1 Tax=Mycena venus TaxID=2733690 RepID=A0A8H6Y953_9AGAR|nr:hypothetical protein MVEN_01101600 [Mycena venus]
MAETATAPATIEINDAMFCTHFKEVCTDCDFDGREENDAFFGFDPIDREGHRGPTSHREQGRRVPVQEAWGCGCVGVLVYSFYLLLPSFTSPRPSIPPVPSALRPSLPFHISHSCSLRMRSLTLPLSSSLQPMLRLEETAHARARRRKEGGEEVAHASARKLLCDSEDWGYETK